MAFSALQVMKRLASERFSLGKDPEFAGFEKIEITEACDTKDMDDLQADIEVWALIRVSYEGTPPESYRILNQMIMDWVEEHEKTLKKLINPKLLPWLKEQYKDIDSSELDENLDDYIWEDQVDYMSDIDEDKKTITFTLEMVLEIEDEDDDSE